MAFATPENVYIVLEGGTVLPVSGVTDEKTTADVVIYDGETYRDDLSGGTGGVDPAHQILIGSATVTNPPTGDLSDAILISSGPSYESYSDVVTHIPPRYKGKQRTLWSYPRSGKLTHVVWADLVQGTSNLAPYRLGMTPTSMPS